jgi:hypothetical protein
MVQLLSMRRWPGNEQAGRMRVNEGQAAGASNQ